MAVKGAARLATDALTLERVRDHDPARHAKFFSSRVLIYGALLLWAFISPVPDLLDGHDLVQDRGQRHARATSIPWVDFMPDWKAGARSACRRTRSARPRRCATNSCMRFENSILASVGASLLAVVIGSLAAYGLSRFQYKFGPWRNKDISFFFLSQLDPAARRPGDAVPRSSTRNWRCWTRRSA